MKSLVGGGSKPGRFWLISLVIILLIGRQQAIAAPGESDEMEANNNSDGAEEGVDHKSHHEDDHHNHNNDDDYDLDTLASIEVSSSSVVSPSHQEHDHDHHDHHDHPHQNVAKEHGESCGSDENSACNTAKGLSCVDGACECDKDAGQVFSVELGKCEAMPSKVVHEVKDNSLEDGEVKGEQSREELTQNDQEPGTTAQPVVTVANRENSLEEGEEKAEEKVDRPVKEIQHRSDGEQDEEGESKEKVGVMSDDNKCKHVNCEETLGRYSKCDEETGECGCHDVDDLNRPLIQQNGKCVIVRHINDPCTSHDECTATIAGQAWCHLDLATQTRFCQCEMFHYYDESLKECLPFASTGLDSPCKTDMQCTGFQVAVTGHGLGPNAKCNREKGQCECKMDPNGQKAFLHDNYCFFQLVPNSPCHIHRECEVSFLGQDVECTNGVCMCRNGENITAVSCPSDPDDAVSLSGGSRRIDGSFDDDDDGVIDRVKSAMGLDMPNFVFIMIIGAVVLLAVVILSVFIVRKRHKYSMVRSREPKDEPDSPL